MALKFICDNCGKEYTANRTLAGIKIEKNVIEDETSPCPECIAEAEVAKEEALKKRKKKT